MSTEIFLEKIETYASLSKESKNAWVKILRQKIYEKGENLISEGQIPRKVAFVLKGLFSQYYITDTGDTVIKYFFPELRIAGSVVATLSKAPGIFTITALEKSTVLEYDFWEFKNLAAKYPDIAAFYIKYMEQHWVIEKEPYEISLRHDSARKRYDDFLKKYPHLLKRLKKHHIAAYLGITPTQLSRILPGNK